MLQEKGVRIYVLGTAESLLAGWKVADALEKRMFGLEEVEAKIFFYFNLF